MDRATPPGRPQRDLRLERGVTIREYTNRSRFQIAFSYRGTECRELVPGAIKQSTINYAAGLRAEVVRKIAQGTFRNADYLSEIPRAGQFDSRGQRIRVRKLLNAKLNA